MDPEEHIAKIIANESDEDSDWRQYLPAAREIIAEYMITPLADWRHFCATGEELC